MPQPTDNGSWTLTLRLPSLHSPYSCKDRWLSDIICDHHSKTKKISKITKNNYRLKRKKWLKSNEKPKDQDQIFKEEEIAGPVARYNLWGGKMVVARSGRYFLLNSEHFKASLENIWASSTGQLVSDWSSISQNFPLSIALSTWPMGGFAVMIWSTRIPNEYISDVIFLIISLKFCHYFLRGCVLSSWEHGICCEPKGFWVRKRGDTKRLVLESKCL